MINENKDSKNEFFIDSEDLDRLKNYQYPPIPEAEHCPYCNKKLSWKGLINPFDKNRIFSWFSIIDCDCEEYKKNKEQKRILEAEEKRAKEEHERKMAYQRKIEYLFKQSNISKRGMKRTFENYETNDENIRVFNMAKKYTDNWDKYKENGTGLIFIGKYGTRKNTSSFCNSEFITYSRCTCYLRNFYKLNGKIKRII